MNYLREILAFYDLLQSNKLSTGQIALWHALMCINNKARWAEWFTVPNLTLELFTGLSRQGIVKSRNVLKQTGLIDFRSNGTKAASYKMFAMSNSLQDSLQDEPTTLNSVQDSLQSSVQDSLQGSLQDSVQDSSALNKQNKNKKDIYNNINNNACACAYEVYEQNIGLTTPVIVDAIDGYLADGIEEEMICAVIEEAAKSEKRSWLYINKILTEKLSRGIKTAAAYNLDKQKWERRKRDKSCTPQKRSKSDNYDDGNRSDYAALEEQILDDIMREDDVL